MKKLVVVREAAWACLSAYFGIGAKKEHRHEQLCALGGIIRGRVIDIRLALPLMSAEESGTHVKIPGEQWFYAIQTLSQCEGLVLAGSAHTHPGMACFLSQPDRETHRLMFPNGVSIVCSPSRREIAAYSGDGSRASLLLP